jgi:hypothetical protein
LELAFLKLATQYPSPSDTSEHSKKTSRLDGLTLHEAIQRMKGTICRIDDRQLKRGSVCRLKKLGLVPSEG